MPADIRLAQVYELQRVALTNVHYYAARVSKLTQKNRVIQFVTTLAASGTVVSAIRDIPPQWHYWKLTGIAVSLISAIAASIIVAFNLTEKIATLERMHSAYKMLYHSAETLAKQTIGASALTPEQAAVAAMLELQLATLGPQDEIGPDREALKKAQEETERQLPDSYYYPESA